MFLEKLGLNDVAELPPLGEFVPGADVFEALERGLRPDPLDDARAVADDDPDDTASTRRRRI